MHGRHPTARHATPTVPRCLGPGSLLPSSHQGASNPQRPMGHREPYLYTNDLDGLTRTLLPSLAVAVAVAITLFTPSSGPAAGGTVVKVKHQLLPLGGAQQKSGGRSRLAIMPARSWCFFSFSSQASPRPRPRLPAPLPLPVPLSIPGADIVRIVMMAEAQRWKMEWRYESKSQSEVACIVLSRSGSWQFPRAVVPSDSRPSRLSALPDCRVCFYGALAHEAGSDLGASTWSH